MPFRLKAFGLHVLASATALTTILGGLFAGWYHGPGWYLSDVAQVVLIMACVDVVMGPLLTFVVASPNKLRRTLFRDLAVIATVQLFALGYGAVLLWRGRPLYYAYSGCCLTLVQAYDLDPADAASARRQNLPYAPYWNSLPHWVWAPLPNDPAESGKIVAAESTGGYDITAMPTHYQPFKDGLLAVRKQLSRLDDSKFFFLKEKKLMKQTMQEAGLPTDQANILPFTGRRRPMVAVFDPASGTLINIIRPD